MVELSGVWNIGAVEVAGLETKNRFGPLSIIMEESGVCGEDEYDEKFPVMPESSKLGSGETKN